MSKTVTCHVQNQISSADQVAAVFYRAGRVIQKLTVQASISTDLSMSIHFDFTKSLLLITVFADGSDEDPNICSKYINTVT